MQNDFFNKILFLESIISNIYNNENKFYIFGNSTIMDKTYIILGECVSKNKLAFKNLASELIQKLVMYNINIKHIIYIKII